MKLNARSEFEPGAPRAPGDVDEAWLAKMTPEELQRWHSDCLRKHEQLARREIDLEEYLRSVPTGRLAIQSVPPRLPVPFVRRRIGKARAPRRARRSRVARQARAPTGGADPAPERRRAAHANTPGIGCERARRRVLHSRGGAR
jgi:hypothetical protein